MEGAKSVLKIALHLFNTIRSWSAGDIEQNWFRDIFHRLGDKVKSGKSLNSLEILLAMKGRIRLILVEYHSIKCEITLSEPKRVIKMIFSDLNHCFQTIHRFKSAAGLYFLSLIFICVIIRASFFCIFFLQFFQIYERLERGWFDLS